MKNPRGFAGVSKHGIYVTLLFDYSTLHREDSFQHFR